jgi:hypothetical protein
LEDKIHATGKEFVMKLLSGAAPTVSKKFLVAGFAVAVLGMSPAASAEPKLTAHPETASALKCLLDHGQNGCRMMFEGSASRAAQPWLWHNPNRDFELGALLSSAYARTEAGENAYIIKLLNGRPTDLYDVKFKYHEKTFYIAHPGTDGKIRYLLIRDGGPDDERTDLFTRGPG